MEHIEKIEIQGVSHGGVCNCKLHIYNKMLKQRPPGQMSRVERSALYSNLCCTFCLEMTLLFILDVAMYNIATSPTEFRK